MLGWKPNALNYRRLQFLPLAVSKSRRQARCQRVFCRSHLFHAASLPLKTLMSDLPDMPGTMPVPVYCQKVKGWLPYFSRGWPATERSQ